MFRLTACAAALLACCATVRAEEPPHSAELDAMIVKQARRHGVPEKLVRRVVMRESRYNPRARNHSFWGLMQISYPTARSMGFRGSPTELLDPIVNLTYAVPYLANAFIIAGKQEDAAVRLYASGYYTTAKSRNLLDQLRTADSAPVVPDDGFLVATTRPVSNLITAVVGGPPLPAQQTAAAAPSPAAASTDQEPEVMMTSGKNGYQPPKKWIKDGGVTLIAKGEQRIDQVAAYSPPQDTDSAKGRPHFHGKSKKITDFAALDAPPASAQAYAAPAEAAGAQSAPQAAIAQATAGPTAVPPEQPVAQAAEAEPEAKPAKSAHGKSRAHKVAAKKTDDGAAPVAAAEATPGETSQDKPGKGPGAKKVAAQTKSARVAKKSKAADVAVAAKSDEPTTDQAATKWRPFGTK